MTKYDHSVINVVIPNGVTSIGASEFDGGFNLKTVTIPNSVTSIGNKAFYYCESLKSITIPNSVTTIGNYAFRFCENIIIQCNRNSYAEEYAKENNIPCKIIN